MSNHLSVLLIEDNADHVALIRRSLSKASKGSVQIESVGRVNDGIHRLAATESKFDAVLTDLNLPDSTGLDTARKVVDAAADIPVIVLTSLEIDDQGIRAVQERAEDYLPKSKLDGDLLLRSIRCAVERGARRLAESQLHETHGALEVARAMQTSMLPTSSPDIPGVDLAAFSEQADAVGGDYYDYLQLPNGDWVFVVGDASGHGPGAAMFMAQATACIRTLFTVFDDIGEILRRANDLLHRETPEMSFMSLQLIQVDAKRKRLLNSSAGHGPALLFGSDGEIRHEITSTGLLLGMAANMKYSVSKAGQVSAGDTLVMVSDGVDEAMNANRELFGVDRLIDCIRSQLGQPASSITECIRNAVWQHCGDLSPHDDVTALVVRWIED